MARLLLPIQCDDAQPGRCGQGDQAIQRLTALQHGSANIASGEVGRHEKLTRGKVWLIHRRFQGSRGPANVSLCCETPCPCLAWSLCARTERDVYVASTRYTHVDVPENPRPGKCGR